VGRASPKRLNLSSRRSLASVDRGPSSCAARPRANRTGTFVTSGDRTRERIETAALELFLERGYAGTPLRLIAEAAEVTTPALYWHYRSKDELCFTIVAQEYRSFGELVMAAMHGQSPIERLRSYVEEFVSVQLRRRTGRNQLGFDQLVASLPDKERAGLRQIQRPLFETLRGILRSGQAEGVFGVRDATVAALALIAMCNYTFTWYRQDGPLSVAQIAEAYGNYAVRLARGGPTEAWQRPDRALGGGSSHRVS